MKWLRNNPNSKNASHRTLQFYCFCISLHCVYLNHWSSGNGLLLRSSKDSKDSSFWGGQTTTGLILRPTLAASSNTVSKKWRQQQFKKTVDLTAFRNNFTPSHSEHHVKCGDSGRRQLVTSAIIKACYKFLSKYKKGRRGGWAVKMYPLPHFIEEKAIIMYYKDTF